MSQRRLVPSLTAALGFALPLLAGWFAGEKHGPERREYFAVWHQSIKADAWHCYGYYPTREDATQAASRLHRFDRNVRILLMTSAG